MQPRFDISRSLRHSRILGSSLVCALLLSLLGSPAFAWQDAGEASPTDESTPQAGSEAAEATTDDAEDAQASENTSDDDTTTDETPEPTEEVAPPLPPVDAAWVGNRVDYAIEARLDGEAKRIKGRLVLTWKNGMDVGADELWFHLYLNAFSNNRSSHLSESGGRLRGHKVEDGWGWSEVKRIALLGETEDDTISLLPTFRFRQPDDGRREDRTVFSVDLPRKVAPGEEVKVEIEWDSQIPRVRRRTGFKDDFLLMAQWFPKLGVFEGDRGWNCHQFHMNSEFFSDYGTYDVTLDLPIEYKDKVFASGRDERPEINGDRIKARFHAPTKEDAARLDSVKRKPVVHDFTWTGNPDYEVHLDAFKWKDWKDEFRVEVERAAKAFGPTEKLDLRDVEISVLLSPERADQGERHARATSAALFFYGLWFGGYPYEHITVIDPPWGGRAAGGMEYPTLFTAGSRMFTTPEDHEPESVTVHEAGHQFWYGLVGNNEFEASWMDEGLNSYTDSEVLYRVYGPRRDTTLYFRESGGGSRTGYPISGRPVINLLPTRSKLGKIATLQGIEFKVPLVDWDVSLPGLQHDDFLALWRDQPWFTFMPRKSDPRMNDRTHYLASPDADRVDSYAWEYLNRTSYSVNSYSRPATILRSLPPLIGYSNFLRGMRHYAKTWRYRHPYPDDFFRTFQEGAGVDIDWYFRETFRGTGRVDWEVSVQNKKLGATVGLVRTEDGEWVDATSIEDPDESQEKLWESRVTVRRHGTLRLPVKVRVALADGTVEDFEWSREDQAGATYREFTLRGAQRVVSAVVDPRDPDDPEAGYWLDSDLSNNEWYEAHDRVTPLRWGERVLASFQHGLTWFVGLGG